MSSSSDQVASGKDSPSSSSCCCLESLLQTKNVLLFIPNLIGYARILLLLLSMALMQSHYILCAVCYGLSVGLDMLDGFAARKFHQSSRLGALLDMLTDRCGTLALVFTLGIFYPSFSFFLSLSSLIDISMHWLHTHVSLLKGQSSHKTGLDDSLPFILRFYYENKTFLTYMCCMNEAFYGSLYVSYFTPGYFYFFYIAAGVTFPFAVLKTGLALLQGYYAALEVVQIDVKERMSKAS
uniref:CDP-diacylglycerol--inositol 3-phosphatidyltransferase n=1 Tax=Caligus rogercresseyi TaxID=217165 RepID=C1BN16_CALRO|nr:CDP-diacylglycerol--inositol 3-phosphatidyltransferase [Caligus rogercresseyi]|eukprot:TRINITY_DN4810_c0_g1_i1.p1 TRINITY_DN4810_c0_g1~~TRINITY_DN4810_c0_g1_i1.p1  ORF type:complete len:238 (-),score=81.76 TRINITY_DN4810_c0_g1_i1:947-1660(-)